MYYLSFWGSESRHSLTGFFASGSPKAIIKVSAGIAVSSEDQLGKNLLPSSYGFVIVQFLIGCQNEDLSFLLAAGQMPSSVAMWASPTWLLASSRAAKERERVSSQDGYYDLMQCNHSYVIACTSLPRLARGKTQALPILNGNT